MTAKKCRDCCELKDASEFYVGRNACKSCVRAAVKARRDANLDAVRAHDRERSKKRDHTGAQRRYRERNRDEINAAQRARRAADPERAREKDRQYYQANTERFATARRKWKMSNPEKLALYDARRRARRAGAMLGHVDFDALRDFFNDCYLCAQRLTGDIHMDHVIPLARGGAHCNENLRPTHATCNLRKHDHMLSELSWYQGPTDIGVMRP